VVIVATNHSAFEDPTTLQQILALASDDCLLVDPWNSLGTTQLFTYAAEVTALRHRPSPLDVSPDTRH
jgi:UDP-N-acetyl-D-mannosaminuronic acid dehydrogenase